MISAGDKLLVGTDKNNKKFVVAKYVPLMRAGDTIGIFKDALGNKFGHSFLGSGLISRDITIFKRKDAKQKEFGIRIVGEVKPQAPQMLEVTPLSPTQMRIRWKDNSNNEDYFVLERAGKSVTLPKNTTIYYDDNLIQNTEYFYKVAAVNAGGKSWSPPMSSMTLGTPQSGWVLQSSAISASQINLEWESFLYWFDEIGFYIERKKGVDGSWSLINTLYGNWLTNSQYSDIGLDPETLYFYRIRAFNPYGSGAYSNETDSTTLEAPPTEPNPPYDLYGTPLSASQIDIFWRDDSDDETGFKIERKKTAGGVYAQIATVNADIQAYSDSGLESSTTYYYRVRAYNDVGDSDYCDETAVVTFDPPPTAPNPPTNLIAVAGYSNMVILNWTDNSGNEAGFKIERRSGADPYVQIGITGIASFIDNSLAAHTTYYYQVRAYNNVGNSGYSNEAMITTLGTPNAPTLLAATTVSQSQINLAWHDNSNNEIGFKIEKKISGGTYQEIFTTNENIKNYNDSGLNSDTTYYYRIRAYNTFGDSGYSNEASARTLQISLVNKSLINEMVQIYNKTAGNFENYIKIQPTISTSGNSTYSEVTRKAGAINAEAWNGHISCLKITYQNISSLTLKFALSKSSTGIGAGLSLIDNVWFLYFYFSSATNPFPYGSYFVAVPYGGNASTTYGLNRNPNENYISAVNVNNFSVTLSGNFPLCYYGEFALHVFAIHKFMLGVSDSDLIYNNILNPNVDNWMRATMTVDSWH